MKRKVKSTQCPFCKPYWVVRNSIVKGYRKGKRTLGILVTLPSLMKGVLRPKTAK